MSSKQKRGDLQPNKLRGPLQQRQQQQEEEKVHLQMNTILLSLSLSLSLSHPLSLLLAFAQFLCLLIPRFLPLQYSFSSCSRHLPTYLPSSFFSFLFFCAKGKREK